MMWDDDLLHLGAKEPETWFYRRGVMNVPCPECGGTLLVGEVYDWPADCGGDCEGDEVRCRDCKKTWTVENAPSEFDDPEHPELWNATMDSSVWR